MTVSGQVLDSETGKPISSAEISYYQTTHSLLTNTRGGRSAVYHRLGTVSSRDTGHFQFIAPNSGSLLLRAEAWSYQTFTVNIEPGLEPVQIRLLSRIDFDPGRNRTKVLARIHEAKELLDENRDLDKAEKILRKMTRRWIDSAFLNNLYGTVAMRRNDFASAEAAFSRAHQLAPQDPAPLLNLATLYNWQSDYRRAAQMANAALEIDSLSAKANFLLGEARYRLREYDIAQTDLMFSLDLNPDLTAEAYVYLGNMHLLRHEYEQAVDWYREVLARFKDYRNRPELLRVIDNIEAGRFSH